MSPLLLRESWPPQESTTRAPGLNASSLLILLSHTLVRHLKCLSPSHTSVTLVSVSISQPWLVHLYSVHHAAPSSQQLLYLCWEHLCLLWEPRGGGPGLLFSTCNLWGQQMYA
jgi:hypothetical protein